MIDVLAHAIAEQFHPAQLRVLERVDELLAERERPLGHGSGSQVDTAAGRRRKNRRRPAAVSGVSELPSVRSSVLSRRTGDSRRESRPALPRPPPHHRCDQRQSEDRDE